MSIKIYRNGEATPDPASKTILVNLGVFAFALGMGYLTDRYFKYVSGHTDLMITLWTYATFFIIAIFVYLYRTITRLRPLAIIEGDIMTVNTGLLGSKKVDLGKASKIIFQYSSEHDQRMKVKYPKEIPLEFDIKQTNCSTESLASFVTKNHNVEVSYS